MLLVKDRDDDDAPGGHEVAMDGVTTVLVSWTVIPIDASRYNFIEYRCAFHRVVPPLRTSCSYRARRGRASLPGAKLSLPIVIDVIGS